MLFKFNLINNAPRTKILCDGINGNFEYKFNKLARIIFVKNPNIPSSNNAFMEVNR